MKNISLLLGTLLLVSLASLPAQIEPEMLMTLSSTEFIDGAMIPDEFTCKGKDASPPLEISRLPEATKSLALIVEDRDAPGGLFTHWLVWNIEPTRLRFLTATPPAGSEEGRNDFGKSGYSGPCPSSGVHRYYFTAYALNSPLDLPESAQRADVLKAMEGKVLKEATLIGKYSHVAQALP